MVNSFYINNKIEMVAADLRYFAYTIENQREINEWAIHYLENVIRDVQLIIEQMQKEGD